LIWLFIDQNLRNISTSVYKYAQSRRLKMTHYGSHEINKPEERPWLLATGYS